MNERLHQLQTDPILVLQQRRETLIRQGCPVFDLATGDPGEPPPEFVTAGLSAALLAAQRHPDVSGQAGLRRAAAGYLQRRFGVTVDPECEVLPTLGARDAIFHLPMCLVQVPSDKDLVLYPEPAPPVFETGALFAEAWTYPLPLVPGSFLSLAPDLVPEATLRRAAVVLLASPHDPTGCCLSAELLQSWVAARQEYGFTLVCDESGIDLHGDGERPRSVLEFGKEGCLVVQSTSLRSGLTGLRSGFVAGDGALVEHYRRFRAGMGIMPPDFVQVASALAWNDDAHVEARRRTLNGRRAAWLRLFADLGLAVAPGTAGPFLWVAVPAGTTDVDYAARCLEHGILVAPGRGFGRDQQRHIRVALMCSAQDHEQALQRWPR